MNKDIDTTYNLFLFPYVWFLKFWRLAGFFSSLSLSPSLCSPNLSGLLSMHFSWIFFLFLSFFVSLWRSNLYFLDDQFVLFFFPGLCVFMSVDWLMDVGFGVSGLVLDPLYFTANSGRFDKKGFLRILQLGFEDAAWDGRVRVR